ncbi:MAG: TIGR04211 family SH3 domain-containing protein [Gammaproteobacteria bacterium]|nr:TIGR04211 family SH3 domain-containing protein [Gammaproteobacteria bacterium]
MKKIAGVLFLALMTSSFTAWCQQDSKKNDIESDIKETQYVTDKLRLSLYKRADGNSGILRLLVSGDVLYVLDKTGPYSKVRTVEGETGWVKNGFLVSTPTDSFLLIEEQKKNEILVSQLEKYADTQKIVEDYENTIEKMNQDSESTLQELALLKTELEKFTISNSELQQQLDVITKDPEQISWRDILPLAQHYWYAGLAGILLLVLVGFLLGKKIIEAQIRRRFQGIKVW